MALNSSMQQSQTTTASHRPAAKSTPPLHSLSVSVDSGERDPNGPQDVTARNSSDSAASITPVAPASPPKPTSKPLQPDEDEMVFCGVDLGVYSRTTQFIFLGSSVFLFYFAYSLLQEFIFKRVEGFHFGLYLTFLQFLQYVIISGRTLYFRPVPEPRRAPISDYALIGFLSVTTMALSNISIQYLNYPTQVMFKSCKLIPVMLVGVMFMGKKYTWLDYLAMVSLTSGMIIFSVGDSLVNTQFPTAGLVSIGLALLADALIGNVQEKSMNKYNSSTTEMIFYSKGIGSIFLFVALLATGELVPAFVFCWERPIVYLYFLVFASVGCMGEFFVMALVKQFGALVAATVTSSRKLMSIMASFILFPKPFTFIYAIGTLQVFFGIGLEVYLKNTKGIHQLIEQSRLHGVLSYLCPIARISSRV